MYIYKERTSSF